MRRATNTVNYSTSLPLAQGRQVRHRLTGSRSDARIGNPLPVRGSRTRARSTISVVKVAAVQHDIVWNDRAGQLRAPGATHPRRGGVRCRPRRAHGDVLDRLRRRRRRDRRARRRTVGAVPRRPGRRARRVGLRQLPGDPRRCAEPATGDRSTASSSPGPDGTTHRYRKIHSFTYGGEPKHFRAGDELTTFDHRRAAGHAAGLLRPALRRRVLAACRRHRRVRRHRQLAGATAAALAGVAAGPGDREPRVRRRMQSGRLRRGARLRRRQPGRRPARRAVGDRSRRRDDAVGDDRPHRVADVRARFGFLDDRR